MKLKVILAQIWAFLSGLFKKFDKFIDQFAPIAIKVVDAIKTVNESTTGDIIETILAAVIPGNADDKAIRVIRAKLKEILPKLLLQLNITQSIAAIENPNEQLKAIINAINMSPDEVKNMYYHVFSTKILEALSDGKLTWSESVHIAEYYYVHIYKK